MIEKSGFVYIWYDRKRKMYYIGCHWGKENDGYICSSNRMRDAYRRRPEDFKRRIIERNIERNILLEKEHKWLSFIQDDELSKKYYNLRKHKWGHWSSKKEKLSSVSEKVRRFQMNLVENGTHQWSGEKNPSIKSIKDGTHPWLKQEHSDNTRRIQYELVASGIHPFLGGEVSSKSNMKRVEDRTHNFLLENRKMIDEKRCHTWEITFPDGQVIVIKNLTQFCKKKGLNQGGMNQVSLGRRKHHKLFKCRKIEDSFNKRNPR